MFQNLTYRRVKLEEMDKPDIAPEALEGALRALSRMNLFAQTANLFWTPIRKILQDTPQDTPLRILDVGCGGGDLSRRLETRARKEGYVVQVDGCDINPVAIAMAQREGEAAGCSGQFFVSDAIADDFPVPYDIVVSSLFLHHLGEDDAVRALKHMGACAQRALLVSDLLRTRRGLLYVYLATRTLTRSPIVHQDGVTSLFAAYTYMEVRALAGRAGLRFPALTVQWPERFLLEWSPD